MKQKIDFTQGSILGPLMKFTLPIIAALILQALYGAVDLLVVGQFASPGAVSAVATGSQVLHTLTLLITGLAMGITVLIGQQIGQKNSQDVGHTVGTGIILFTIVSILITAVMMFATPAFVRLLQAPKEAFADTVSYVMICSGGILFIAAYNILGSIFRGIGDSKTPFIAVLIACIGNVILDLVFVAGLHLSAAGAALATVLAQTFSVILSLILILRRGLPFPFSREHLKLDKALAGRILRLGFPCALQDVLVSISFLAIMAIVNSLGVIPSAGVGVAEKLCVFIMLVPSAYMQSISAYVAQNIGAGQPHRAKRGMLYGMATSFAFGILLGYLSFFHGELLARIFSQDTQVVAAAAQYLKGYSIDTLLTAFLFCFMGYFNGCGKTGFVMIEGIIGAFGVRIPVSYFFSKAAEVSLFHVSLATPSSTIVQIILCSVYFLACEKRRKKEDSISYSHNAQ